MAALDTLTGSTGADTFLWGTDALGSVDVITDYNRLTDNDVLDISDILVDYDPLNDLITDFVEISNHGWDSILKVDRDGTGTTYSMTQIATLQNVTGLTDEAALVASGHLVVA